MIPDIEKARPSVVEGPGFSLWCRTDAGDDGNKVFEILNLPEDLGRACALASEATFKKFGAILEKDAAWLNM